MCVCVCVRATRNRSFVKLVYDRMCNVPFFFFLNIQGSLFSWECSPKSVKYFVFNSICFRLFKI